jgi:hypothetical protein
MSKPPVPGRCEWPACVVANITRPARRRQQSCECDRRTAELGGPSVLWEKAPAPAA